MAKLRVASFNAENLFDRPKVFNFQDKSVGDRILKRIDEFQKILRKPVYSAADKRELVKEYNKGTPSNDDSPLKEFIEVREDQGKLWKKQGWSITGVQADGAGDWNGTIIFKTAKFSETARTNTAKVIRAVKADVACIVEADSRPSLKSFDADLLRSMYPYEMLLDGNDQRGIDVGIYSKHPLGGIWTHMFDAVGRSKTFSRDCPEYEVLLPNGQFLYVLCNHLKSKGYGVQSESNARRKRQAEAIAEILKGYDLTEDLVIVAGDMNDTPESAPLKPLLKVRNLYDVLELQFPNAPAKRWTYHYRSFEQIDYLLVSKPLKECLVTAGVERRGIYDLHNLTAADDDIETQREYKSVTHWTNAASDHGAVWAEFDL